MDIQVDKELIITKLKRNGHYLSRNGLQMLTQFLEHESHPNKKLDEIITKINEMVIIDQQQFNQKTLKLSLELLSHRSDTGKTFNSYEKLINHMNRWSIFYLSPYQSKQRFFIDQPTPDFFEFKAENYLQMNLKRFKQIKEHNIIKNMDKKQHCFIGVIYETYSSKGTKIMLQNQINQMQLVFPTDFVTECFLISGCTYIAKGQFKTGDLQLTVTEIQLPKPLKFQKQSLCKQKLKIVCDNILHTKSKLDFTVQDMRTYQILYNKEENKGKPILIFGNVCLTKLEINRIKSIYKLYPYGIQCLIIMITDKGHQNLDLKKEFDNNPVYIIPHMDSEGPRILPKIPVLRNDYNVKITTNPARISIHGKQCMFLNYPLVQNLYSKSLIAKQIDNVDSDQMVKRVSRMLYSQNNVAICNKIFWKQSHYLNIFANDILFVCDRSCPQNYYKQDQSQFVSLGNFNRDGDFIAFMPEIKDSIQLCQQSR